MPNKIMRMVINVYYDLKKDESEKEAYYRMFNVLDDAGQDNNFSFSISGNPQELIDNAEEENMRIEIEREEYTKKVINRFKAFVDPTLYNMTKVEHIIRLSIEGCTIEDIRSGKICSPGELAAKLAIVAADIPWIIN